jgi:hypothetical protein
MPTILLARPTHRLGRLHIRKEEGDEKVGNDAPADMVHAKFRGFLEKDFDDSSPENFDAYKLKKGGGKATVGAQLVEDHIHSAMQHTYAWMRDRMQSRLGPALVNIERHYYNSRAPDSPHPKDELGDAELLAAAGKAAAHNNKLMQDFGWTGAG